MSRRHLKSALSGTNMQLPNENREKRKRSDRDDNSPNNKESNILSRLGRDSGGDRESGRRRRGDSRDRDGGRGDRRRSISPSESRDRGDRDDRRRDRDRNRSDRRGGERERRGSPPRDDRRRGGDRGDRRKRGRSISPSEDSRRDNDRARDRDRERGDRDRERGDRDRRERGRDAPESRDRAKAPAPAAKPSSGGKKIREDIRRSISNITAKAFVPALSNPLVLLSKSLCGEDLFEEIAPIRYSSQEVASTKERRSSSGGNRRASRRASAGHGLTDGSGEGTGEGTQKTTIKSEEKESVVSGGENSQSDEAQIAGTDDSMDLYGDVGDMDMYGDLDTSFAGTEADAGTDPVNTNAVVKEEEAVVDSTVITGAIAKSYPMEAIPQSSHMVSTKRMKLISDALQGAGFSSSFQRSFDDAKALLSK